MNKYVLSILLLFIGHFVSAQTGYKQKLTDFSSITFPQQPIRLDTLGHTSYRYIDALATYVVTIRASTDKDMVLDAAELSEYYEGVIEGVLKAANGQLISKKEFELSGLSGVDFTYTASDNPNLPDLRFQRVIFINDELIVINFLTSSENKAAAENEVGKFFNSFVINSSGVELTQGAENPIAFKIGTLFGRFAGFSLTLGVLVGGVAIIIFLVRKSTAKSKPDNRI